LAGLPNAEVGTLALLAPLAESRRRVVRHEAGTYPQIAGEFWTARQRQMNSLHYAISYRGSFKPELPAFFIERFSKPGDIVFDPFSGRGTTVLQAVLSDRLGWGNDVNPLSELITRAKVCPATLEQVRDYLADVDFDDPGSGPDAEDLGMFYHPDTLVELMALRRHVHVNLTATGRFVALIALSRLHGHSPGFLSVYSFPQISVTREAQRRINERRGQRPEYRDVRSRIIRKAQRALRDCDPKQIRQRGRHCLLTQEDSRDMSDIPSGAVDLIVTSPPFLNKVDYILDNWLEMWFLRMEPDEMEGSVVQTSEMAEWQEFILGSLREMRRVLRPGGTCVVEVGDVLHNSDEVNLDEVIVELAADADLSVQAVMVQVQEFTKLAHCFRVRNNEKGTNTNRCVVLRR